MAKPVQDKLFNVLLKNGERVRHEKLIEDIWGVKRSHSQYYSYVTSLQQTVSRLRKRLPEDVLIVASREKDENNYWRKFYQLVDNSSLSEVVSLKD